VNILEENNFGIHSAPLGSFDQVYDVEELEEMDEEVFDASQANEDPKGPRIAWRHKTLLWGRHERVCH
jgi:hypothetical protein